MDKLKAALSNLKTTIVNAWISAQPTLSWIANAIATIIGLITKMGNTITLILGIAIGYKFAPIFKIIAPILKLVFNLALLPLKILGWL